MIFLDCVNILIITVAFVLSCISNLHMFQLNSYQIKSHIMRLKDNKGRIIPNILFPLISILAIFISSLPQKIFLCIVFLVSLVMCLPKKAKKPLVYTPRIKRQIITTAIIAIAAIIPMALSGGIEYIYCCLIGLFFLAPVVIMISAVINKPIEKSISLSFVNDAKNILGSMHDMKIIGVTGSYGKTSVKYYLNTLLKAKYNVLMTPGSFNTPMGVVRTIREYLKASDEIFVCEMGARHVGDIKEICDINNYDNPTDELKQHLENFMKTIDICKNIGVEVEEVSVDKTLLDAEPAVYVVISCAEATSNMSNLTGIIFGPKGEGKTVTEQMKDHRTKGFSPLIKRRFVIGSYVLQSENQDRYYKNACRVRRLLVDEWKKLFKKYDAVILPVGSGPAPYLDNRENKLSNDTQILEEHLQIGNFGGFPSITIPNGFINNMPVGVNITANCFDDENLLNIAYKLESQMNYKNQIAGWENE